MRYYTLAFSIAVHIVVVVAVVIAPLVANDVLPEPRRAFEFIVVVPGPLPVPPPVIQRATRPAAAASASAAPVEAPSGIREDTGLETFAPAGDESGVPGAIPVGEPGSILIADPPPPPAPPPAPVRVGGSIRQPQKVRHVAPIYPAIAQSARVQGIVILEALLGEDGRVKNVRVLRSIPLLDQAAIDAVRQWQFTPTLLNGEPVPVVMTVTVAFELTGR